MQPTDTSATEIEAPTLELKLTVLIHKCGSAYVAQCLEKDVAAQGPSLDECKRRFAKTLRSQIASDLANHRAPLAALGCAPPEFFDEMLLFRKDSPELPVYVPAKDVRATARFFTAEGAESVAPSPG